MKIAIVGAGKLGLRVIDNLLQGGNSVTVIDKNEELLTKLSSHLDVMTIAGNAKVTSFLKEHNIGDYDFLVATTDKDEKNICIASFAKAIGCSRVIARVRDPEHMNQIEFIKELMNIDHIVNPDLLITNEIYKYLVEMNSLDNGIYTKDKIALAEIKVRKMPELIGGHVGRLSDILPEMMIVAIDRKGKVIIPEIGEEIQDKDILFISGRTDEIKELYKRVHIDKKYTDIQRVMIVGGGKTGLYLAKKLSERGTFVKIIEISKERCQYLSANLKNVMILHGDATDLSLLSDENFEKMDAFVTATGFDEENLLLALTAKRHNIPDVIAKISRESYGEIISSMGIDMVLNPLNISANNIARYIQGTKRILSSTLIHGQAEIIEITATDRMPITYKAIRDLNIPDGVLIFAIHRGREVIIPGGDTVVKDGDKVLMVALLSASDALEPLINVKTKRGLFKGDR